MKLSQSIIYCCTCILFANFSIAQELSLEGVPYDNTPIWTAEVPGVRANNSMAGSGLKWSKISPAGILILATTGGIIGYSPTDGKVLFNLEGEDYKNLSQDQYGEIAGTPFITLVSGGGADANQASMSSSVSSGGTSQTTIDPSLINRQHTVINSINGKVIASSRNAGMKRVDKRFVLTQSNKVMFVGKENWKTSVIAVFDYATGEHWVKENMFKNAGYNEVLLSDPLDVDANGFLIATDVALYYVNSSNGEIKWRQRHPAITMTQTEVTAGTSPFGTASSTQVETEPDPIYLYRIKEKPYVYVNRSSTIFAHHIDSGEKAWKKTRRAFSGNVIVFDPNGVIVCENKIFMYDYATGEPVWDKPAKIDGNVNYYRYVEKGLMISLEDKKKYRLNVVNTADGTMVFDKDVELNGTLVDLSTFVQTEEELNVFDANAGNLMFSEPLKVRRKDNLIAAFKGDKAYVFTSNTNHLYEVDKDAKSITQLTKVPIEFADKESPRYIETLDNGILLHSDQNVLLLGWDGTPIYQTNIVMPKLPFLERVIVFAAAAVISAAGTELAKSTGLEFSAGPPNSGPYRSAGYDAGVRTGIPWHEGVAPGMDNLALVTIFGARLKASKESVSYLFKNVKLESTPLVMAGTYGVVKLEKGTGKPLKVFPFGKDREPQYKVDELSGLLFYHNGGTLSCYKL